MVLLQYTVYQRLYNYYKDANIYLFSKTNLLTNSRGIFLKVKFNNTKNSRT